MIAWCERGPSHATVEEVEAELEAFRGDIQGFEVR